MAKESQDAGTRSPGYFSEVMVEFNKIVWPPQPEWVNGTIAVVVVVTLIASFLGIVDYGLGQVMQLVLG